MTLHPSGIVLLAAIVVPAVGLELLAQIPFAFGPQHSLQAQYAVIVAVMMLVTGIN